MLLLVCALLATSAFQLIVAAPALGGRRPGCLDSARMASVAGASGSASPSAGALIAYFM